MARYNRSYVSDVASYGIIYQYIQKIFTMNSRFNFRKQKKKSDCILFNKDTISSICKLKFYSAQNVSDMFIYCSFTV